MDKTDLHTRMRALRDALPQHDRRKWEEAIFARVASVPQFTAAPLVLAYAATPGELSTWGLLQALWQAGRAVALPRCLPKAGELAFYRVEGMYQLVPGHRSIPEPLPALCQEVHDFTASFCLVPALACDAHCHRLGYGGGYYDRFLAHYPGTSCVPLYSACLLQQPLPAQPWDIPVHFIATETQLLDGTAHFSVE